VLVDGHHVPLLGAVLLGIGVGYVAGMFGIGGGFLLTPLLVVLFGVPLPIAVGTGLCQMVATSLVAYLRHRKVRQGEVRIDLLMLPGSIMGVRLGARALAMLGRAGSVSFAGHSLPWVNLVVETSYVTLLGIVAFNYWKEGKGDTDALQKLRPGPLSRVRVGPSVALPAVHLPAVSALLVAYIGLGLGFFSGMLGIGGGVALNPILIYGFGFPIKQAVGTGIVVLFVTAVAGTATHALEGNVDLRLAVVMLVGATVSAQLGALASRRLASGTLGRIHAAVLVGAMGAVLWDLVSRVR
jgi:uncharacterized membrane protein YfcA